MRDGSISDGLFEKRPGFELEYGLLSLSTDESQRSAPPKRPDQTQDPYERFSFEVGGALAALIQEGDQLRFHRFGTGDFGLTLTRAESLILAIGSCVRLPLGTEVQVQEDERVAELGLYELAKDLDEMDDPEAQVIWIDVAKGNLKAQIKQMQRASNCEHLIVLIKGTAPRNFYDMISNWESNAGRISYQPVDERIADKHSWIDYLDHLPRERPKDLYLRFTIADERIDLCEGEEAFIGAYYVRVDRVYRRGIPGELSSLAIAQMSSCVTKEMVRESADLVLGDCRRRVPGLAARRSLVARLPVWWGHAGLAYRDTLTGALMDAKFHSAIAAIKSGELNALQSLLSEDPTLATSRSSRSHPTLLQCLTLEAGGVANKVEMAELLIDAGAEINGPLYACASGNNVEVAAALLDAGALVDGTADWSPLEEDLYWGSDAVRDLLLERGASVHNLRIAAGLGRVELIEKFFNADGSLKPEAGTIHWPFEDPFTSNLPQPNKQKLQATIDGWSHDSQNVINNAFVYACIHNRIEAAKVLLDKGAEINAIPPGFHYPGTALHNAAGNGHRAMVDFLIERGADPNANDQENDNSPAGWAAYGGHRELRDYLEHRGGSVENGMLRWI